MKRVFLALIIMTGLAAGSSFAASTVILEGNYQGKNLFVQNPFAGSGVGFCTFEVTINEATL